MRKTLRLVRREYKAAVKTKGFIIGLVLAPIFMGGGLIAFAVFKDRVDTTDKALAVVDRSSVIGQAIVDAAERRNEKEIHDAEAGKKIKPAYSVELVEPDHGDLERQRLELSNRVRRGELHAFLDIGPGIVHPGEDPNAARIAYYARNSAMDDMRRWLGWPINNRLRKLRLADAGIDESEVKDLFHWANIDGMGLVSVDVASGDIQKAKKTNEIEAILVPIVTMMLMFMMVMISVPGMLHSVMEEKTQRIAEVLLGSIRPFEFMMGKLLAGIAVSLTSSAVYLIGGFLVIRHMGFEGFIPYAVLPWFFIYMFLAILMLGAVASALGATCSEAKDAQSLMFPILIPALIPMFTYFPIVREPMSSFATWMSLFPPFTPFLMLLRQATPGGVPAWQAIAGLLGVIAFTLAFVWVGGRIFRVALLLQGTPPKLGNIVRWALRG